MDKLLQEITGSILKIGKKYLDEINVFEDNSQLEKEIDQLKLENIINAYFTCISTEIKKIETKKIEGFLKNSFLLRNNIYFQVYVNDLRLELDDFQNLFKQFMKEINLPIFNDLVINFVGLQIIQGILAAIIYLLKFNKSKEMMSRMIEIADVHILKFPPNKSAFLHTNEKKLNMTKIENTNYQIENKVLKNADNSLKLVENKTLEAESGIRDYLDLKIPPSVTNIFQIFPIYGNLILEINPNMVSNRLYVLSIKNEIDIGEDYLCERNSFRNLLKPDISKLKRFTSPNVKGKSVNEIANNIYQKCSLISESKTYGTDTLKGQTIVQEIKNIEKELYVKDCEFVIKKINLFNDD